MTVSASAFACDKARWMDTNYLLKREQVSLVMAHSAAGLEARYSHAALAKAYGLLLAGSRFPHREFKLAATNSISFIDRRALERWTDDGGQNQESPT